MGNSIRLYMNMCSFFSDTIASSIGGTVADSCQSAMATEEGINKSRYNLAFHVFGLFQGCFLSYTDNNQVCVQSRRLGCQHGTARIRCWAPRCDAATAGCPTPPLLIAVSCPYGAQQQTGRTPLLRSNDGTDKRTDGQMDEHPTVT